MATAQLLLELSKFNRLYVLYFQSDGEENIDQEVVQICEHVQRVERRKAPESQLSYWAYRFYIWGNLVFGKPEWVVDWQSKEFERSIRLILKTWDPEIIYFSYHIMGQYAKKISDFSQPKILIDYDPVDQFSLKARNKKKGLRGLKRRLEVASWGKYMKSILPYLDRTIVFTEEDRSVMSRNMQLDSIVHIPLGFSKNNLASKVSDSNIDLVDELIILFVGSFIHPPNVDAALRLQTEIFPKVLNDFPNATLYLVGDSPPNIILENRSERVHVTGFIPDLSELMSKATVFVAPLFKGGGMRIKVMEALSAGKAIVASNTAIYGLSVGHNKELLVANTNVEFVQMISKIFADEALRKTLEDSAYKWANINLGWDEISKAYLDLNNDLLNQSPNI